MALTHLHLIITHLPTYGSLLGSLVLLYGISRKSKPTLLAAYYVLIIAAIGGAIAFYRGSFAEQSVREISGVAKELIEEHEESAESSILLIIVMGTLSLAGIFVTRRIERYSKKMSIAVLILALPGFGIVARTGYLGGKIRHNEIDSANVLPAAANKNEYQLISRRY